MQPSHSPTRSHSSGSFDWKALLVHSPEKEKEVENIQSSPKLNTVPSDKPEASSISVSEDVFSKEEKRRKHNERYAKYSQNMRKKIGFSRKRDETLYNLRRLEKLGILTPKQQQYLIEDREKKRQWKRNSDEKKRALRRLQDPHYFQKSSKRKKQ